jgi:hypothetical protein
VGIVMQLSLLDAAPKPKPKPKPKPVEPPKPIVCKCAGRLVEVDEDGFVWCVRCGRRKRYRGAA